MDMPELKRLYGRLKGLRELLGAERVVRKDTGDDYNLVVNKIAKVIEEDCSDFLLPSDFYYKASGGEFYAQSSRIQSKLFQFMSYLDNGFNLSRNVIEIGSIYNSITDEELKSRCSDILSAPGNFDRVVNQATLVLEDRIRKKSKLDGLIGVELVNKAINSELSKSVLKLSDDPQEHEGFAHICRGIVLSFRNPTHHKIVESYSREDALKVCAFIDLLLRIIDGT